VPTVSSEERVRYRDVTVEWAAQVIARDAVGDRLVHLTMSIPENYRPTVLDTVAIDVGEGQLRRYTVSAVTESAFDVVAFRTERGPATPFLDSVAVGDQVSGLGPERPVKTPESSLAKVIVVGDETVVGTARAIAGLGTASVSSSVMTTHDMSGVAVALPDLGLAIMSNEDQLLEWLSAEVGSGDVSTTGVWVVGEQSVNHAVRTRAKELGVAKENVATRTFWRPDRAGIE
jgi:NADPH-dependent ferric siderophore reductase